MIGSSTRKAALEALTAYANELRTEIERQATKLKRELATVEQSIHALAGDEPQDIVRTSTELPPGVVGKYIGMGPQAAVERYLREHPGISFRPSILAAQLKAQGFSVSNPKLATQQVAIALVRAARKGLAIEGRLDGKKAYQLAQAHGASPGQRKDTE